MSLRGSFAEAIPKCGEEIASTGTERWSHNDTEQEAATLRKPYKKVQSVLTKHIQRTILYLDEFHIHASQHRFRVG